MAIVFDMDTHLREDKVLDVVYDLRGTPFAEFTPRRRDNYLTDPTPRFPVLFDHKLDPWPRKVYENFGGSAANKNKVRERQQQKEDGGIDMDLRVRDMEKAGTDVQFIFPTQISIPSMNEGPIASALCRAYNTWIDGLVKGKREKLSPVAAIPWGYPEGMVEELRHAVLKLGFKTAHTASYTFTRTLDDPIYEPFYAECEKLNVPLMVHAPTYAELGSRFSEPFPIHILGRPLNCAAALTGLVTGGVFERHSNLRAAFFECTAEWILFWMHRMDDEFETHRKKGLTPHISREPSEYIRRNCYVTCETDEYDLGYAARHFNEDNILLASDYPHFDAIGGSLVDTLNERNDLTAIQKEKIAGHNAMTFLGL